MLRDWSPAAAAQSLHGLDKLEVVAAAYSVGLLVLKTPLG